MSVVMNTDHEYLITGAGGQLGSILLRRLARADRRAIGTVSKSGQRPAVGEAVPIDIAEEGAIGGLVERLRPRIIIHAAALTQVQAAWERPNEAMRVNVEATGSIALAAERIGARLVLVSTDMVFDGTRPPYDEGAATCPLSIYGKTKRDAEDIVASHPRGLVARLPLMYGIAPVDRPTTFREQLESIRAGQTLRLFADEYRTPIWLEDAAESIILAAESDRVGCLHLGGPERLSRWEMGRIAAMAMGRDESNIVPCTRSDSAAPEPRPADLSLDSRLFESSFGRPAGRPMAEAMKEIAPSLGE